MAANGSEAGEVAATAADDSKPPAAPMPTPIDLHPPPPPPSPRHRTLDLQEPVGGIQPPQTHGQDVEAQSESAIDDSSDADVNVENPRPPGQDDEATSSLLVHLGKLMSESETDGDDEPANNSTTPFSVVDIPPAPMPGDANPLESFDNSEGPIAPPPPAEADVNAPAPTDIAGDQEMGMISPLARADAQQPLQHQQQPSSPHSAPSPPQGQLFQQPQAPPQQQQQQQQQPGGNVEPTSIADQIRNMVGGIGMSGMNGVRSKAKQYGFPAHADADTLPREIDEFYSYVEAPQVVENRLAWEEWAGKEAETSAEASTSTSNPSTTWTSLPTSIRQSHTRKLLSQLSSKDPDLRLTASRAFLYILQGSYADTHGPEHQIHWIILSTKMARREGAIAKVYEALKRAMWKHDFLSSLPDHVPASTEEGPLLTPQSKAEYMEEVNLELTLSFAQLYLLIETGRRDDEEGADAIEGGDHGRVPEDLMALDPPLPTFLFTVLAALREKNAKGFPVKKLLLCLWKSLLACLGGQKDVRRCKALARKVEGLPVNPTNDLPANTLWPPQPLPTTQPTAPQMQPSASASTSGRLTLGQPRKRRPTKTTPQDFETFREELAVKYPTYTPPRRGPADLPIEKLATAVDPLPPRRLAIRPSQDGGGGGAGGAGEGEDGQIGTPAPTPPPSPRPNKQKYQTDQTRPFVFPYSVSVQGSRVVPYSIEEADRLYKDNMHVSTELWQMWRTKEEMEREERGLRRRGDGRGEDAASTSAGRATHTAPPSLHGGDSVGPTRSNSHDSRGWAGLRALSKLNGGERAPPHHLAFSSTASDPGRPPATNAAAPQSGTPAFTPGGSPRTSIAPDEHADPVDPDNSFLTRGEPTYDRLLDVEAEIRSTLERAEGDHLMAVLDNERYSSNVATLHQQLADVRRLQRVDTIYRGVLPSMQSAVIVLLKLLLATVTAQNASPHEGGLGGPSGMEDAPPPTVEDIDILRHREITTKAISAILLLSLKWFKASHALKFHHLNQFLVDSNCMLLVLKMFGLQEVANSVRAINEVGSFNFLAYCAREAGVTDGQEGERDGDEDDAASSEDGEMINDYSFRNFFSVLNFTRILQKLTKRRVHRILLLTQYKSSAILKRLLKVQHPTLQLYILKIIKSQVPFCGRKWRQSNMKVITGIYLNCRPDLRDEWLSSDVEGVVMESLPQEQALRALVKYYVASRFDDGSAAGGDEAASTGAPTQQQQDGSRVGRPGAHGQAKSLGGTAAEMGEIDFNDAGAGGVAAGEGSGQAQQQQEGPSASSYDFFESEFLLPPLRRNPASRSVHNGPGAAAYIPDDVVEGYLGEYEEILGEVFGTSVQQRGDVSETMMPTSSTAATATALPVPASSPRQSPTMAAQRATGEGGISPSASHVQASASSSTQDSALTGTASGWSSGKWGLTQTGAQTAWNALGEILGPSAGGPEGQRGPGSVASNSDSDSESIASIGELDFTRPNNERGVGDDAAGGGAGNGNGAQGTEGKSDWEHLSPKEMRFLASQPRPPTPGSPTTSGPGGGSSGRRRRRSSAAAAAERERQIALQREAELAKVMPGMPRRTSSEQLRPVMGFEDDDDLVAGEEVEEEEEDEEEEQPLPPPQAGGIDEVEHVFGQ
ncbi:hypothetical protein BDZ90DRAFT_278098 [Jaminaea rosea]|uniref:N1221-domain-containing protein n=1 Tax=Jaminaea rosea TaxID=1569628 RepID=A0A316UX13_9BASI|nr:hypothetical protein BDZ90DRAFT_278098 [Jaminaea rosea]PWN29850.1 hypothetical protein BDZ90DRAFT_278098 [Jaminaea rosea]